MADNARDAIASALKSEWMGYQWYSIDADTVVHDEGPSPEFHPAEVAKVAGDMIRQLEAFKAWLEDRNRDADRA